ncbi:Uncharacterised protein [Mycobacteroides abscessus]|jgi:hypothetical protein|uniref:Bacteriophage protein n=2 Tax=Mycobacteroides abscessus TaxID=36809 RepID=A0AB38D7W9_9MYCO|nr:hypothetical protein I543_0061 [Mycobacteroides abscessus 21]MBE5421909.1 hypothetical protein [Mycobacteroides abscessus]SHQ58186.1 Uncharacterised protein [Mycobacteroides abscessus subsp. abscessus]MBE5453208.1 hypothetical protein [Mycobacteroides abscessus]MBE5495424.1 hypothetical protein [Mycobacteroides abscessus]
MDSLFNGGYLFRGDGARGDHRIFVCIHAKYCWSDVYAEGIAFAAITVDYDAHE